MPCIAYRLSLLDNDHGKNSQIGVDDAAPDGLALLRSGAPLAVARVALLEEESDAAVGEDALLHGEALLVVAAANAEDIPIKLLAEGLALDLGADAVVI